MNQGNNGGGGRYVSGDGLVPEINSFAAGIRNGEAPRPQVRAAGPAVDVASDHAEVHLSRAYQAHDVAVTRFQLRKPVTRDIRAFGNPFKVKLTPQGMIEDIDVRYDAVAKYVAVLSVPPLPPSTVDQFEFEDIDSCAAAMMPFFMRLAS